MNSYLKKGFLLGVGIASFSKEKVETYINDLVSKGEVAPNEAKELIQEMIERGEKQEKEWTAEAKKTLVNEMRDIGFAPLEELEALDERVKRLEKSLYEERKALKKLESSFYETNSNGVDDTTV